MKTVIYTHGMGGIAEEAENYRGVFNCPVSGIDYSDYTPWTARETIRREYEKLTRGYDETELISVSIGAYLSMLALSDKPIKRAYFISPVVDMESLILDMMAAQDISEAELKEKGEIENKFGEPLSWKYLSFVRDNPPIWNVPTEILYADKDHLTKAETIKTFAKDHRAGLTVINAEHYIRQDAVLAFLKEKH